MRQEVQATVTLTFDADAQLSSAQLRERIMAFLGDLYLNAPDKGPLVLTQTALWHPIREEAEIYHNPADDRCG